MLLMKSLSGGRGDEAGDDLEERGLSCTVMADDPEDLAVLKLKTDTVKCQETVEILCQAAGRDHGNASLVRNPRFLGADISWDEEARYCAGIPMSILRIPHTTL